MLIQKNYGTEISQLFVLIGAPAEISACTSADCFLVVVSFFGYQPAAEERHQCIRDGVWATTRREG